MTSREIADLTEKRHDAVKRTIDTLYTKHLIEAPQIVDLLTAAGQHATEYRVGRRDSYVTVAQLSPEFTARLVDRWQELETQVAAPAAPAIPRTLADALRLAAQSLKIFSLDTATPCPSSPSPLAADITTNG